jgi:hypothetical protein
MKRIISCLVFVAVANSAQSQVIKNAGNMKTETKAVVCKLTTPELQERKKTVIAKLKDLVLERVETDNGVRFRFESSDAVFDLVTDFIKTERLCCDFFDFHLSVKAETGFMWLELSGPEGTKQFIREEIGF